MRNLESINWGQWHKAMLLLPRCGVIEGLAGSPGGSLERSLKRCKKQRFCFLVRKFGMFCRWTSAVAVTVSPRRPRMLAKWLTSKWQFWAAGALSLKSYDSTLGVHSVLVCFGPLKWSIRRFYQKLVWGGKRKEEKFGRQYSPEDAKPCAHAR